MKLSDKQVLSQKLIAVKYKLTVITSRMPKGAYFNLRKAILLMRLV